MKLKRYSSILLDPPWCGMEERDKGKWVKYSDVMKLIQSLCETLLCDQGHHLKNNEYLNGEKNDKTNGEQ